MSQPKGHYDRTESAAEIKAATDAILVLRDWLQNTTAPAAPRPGSMLATEDILTEREPLSSLVRGMRNRAVDGLELFMDATIHEEKQVMWTRPISPYAPLRMTMEAVSVGRWLIESNRKADRVLRALRLMMQHEYDTKEFALLLAGTREQKTEVRASYESALARLNQLKDAVPNLRQTELTSMPRYTDVMRKFSPKGPDGSLEVDSPLVVWKLSSAILHGNSQILRHASDLEQTSEWEPSGGTGRISSLHMTPKWSILAGCIYASCQHLRELDTRTGYLGTHDYANREVPEAAA